MTLVKKYQLSFAKQILCMSHSKSDNEVYKINDNDSIESSYRNIICSKLNCNDSCIKIYRKIVYNGITYRNGFYVCIFENDLNILNIVNVILYNKDLFLFCQKINCIQYIIPI